MIAHSQALEHNFSELVYSFSGYAWPWSMIYLLSFNGLGRSDGLLGWKSHQIKLEPIIPDIYIYTSSPWNLYKYPSSFLNSNPHSYHYTHTFLVVKLSLLSYYSWVLLLWSHNDSFWAIFAGFTTSFSASLFLLFCYMGLGFLSFDIILIANSFLFAWRRSHNHHHRRRSQDHDQSVFAGAASLRFTNLFRGIHTYRVGEFNYFGLTAYCVYTRKVPLSDGNLDDAASANIWLLILSSYKYKVPSLLEWF